jgi:hypothetical protein
VYAFLVFLKHATCPANLILLDFITPIIVYLVKSANYEAPHCAIFSSLLSLPPLSPEFVIVGCLLVLISFIYVFPLFSVYVIGELCKFA